MNAKEIYSWEPISETKELWEFIDFFCTFDSNIYGITWGLNERVIVKMYADHTEDNRPWDFASIWLDHQPIMLFRRYGKSGQDGYITNRDGFNELMAYLRSLGEGIFAPDVYDPDADLDGFDSFYGHTLSEFYDPSFKPEFQVGDIVNAKVFKNPLGFVPLTDPEYIVSHVKITGVNQRSRYATYQGYELNRAFEGDLASRKVVKFDSNEGKNENPIYVRLDSTLRQIRKY